MSKKKEVKQRFVGGNQLHCQVCQHDLFWERKTLMNTVGMSFINLDWANKSATNYVCNRCGYVHWFLHD